MTLTILIKAILAAVIICLFKKEQHLAGATTTVATNTENEFSKQDVINTIQELGREISYAQWAKSSSKNVILSPLSIAVILNLLMLGSSGTSNLEIKQALNYPSNVQESVVHETYQEIFSTLPQSAKDFEISLYTRIFPQIGFKILGSFIDVSEKSYLSDVESLDYANANVASTERINDWVSDSTNGKIEKLFNNALDTQTVCVIANVIFLNATWLNKFDSRSTKDGKFFTGTETINIPMMNREMYVPYWRFDSEGFEMISLPYVGNQFSMYILKPICGMNLQQIENTLNSNKLNTFISLMKSQKMDVTIPRMRMSLDLDLGEDLKSFGVNQIFSANAGLTRFSDDPRVLVSSIAHKAILEVTEAGTIAAAVTAAIFSTTSLSAPPKVFELNEPSLIFIRDNHNSLILFWGRVMNPEPYLN